MGKFTSFYWKFTSNCVGGVGLINWFSICFNKPSAAIQFHANVFFYPGYIDIQPVGVLFRKLNLTENIFIKKVLAGG